MNNNTNVTQSNTKIESIQEIDLANPNASIIESEQVQSNSPESTGSESSVDHVSISNLIISRPEKARRCSNRLVPKFSFP
jgi:reverse gyrase